MKICLLSSELSPFAKTGGLGDAAAGLARFLASQGVDLRVFMPLYSAAKIEPNAVAPVEFMQGMRSELAGRAVEYSVYTTRLPDSALPIYLIHCPALYNRPGIYDDRGDEHLRFLAEEIRLGEDDEAAWSACDPYDALLEALEESRRAVESALSKS